MRRLHHFLTVVALVVATTSALANVTVTPASGGTNISADTAGSTYTTLGNIVITEGATADFTRPQTGVTLILSAPTGWSFNPGTGSTSAQPGRDVSINSTTVTASTITVNLDVSSSGPAKTDILTITGIQVRPNNGSQGITANGNITASASSTVAVAGITAGSTNFGSLAMVPGNAHHLGISTQPSGTATAGVAFATQPVIRIEDQFNNLRSSDNSTVVTAARSAGSGTLQGTTTKTAASGVATFTNLSHNVATTISIAFSATGLTGATSNNIVVSAAAATTMVFSTSPGASTAGSILSPQPVIRTVDAFGNNSTVGLAASVPVTVSIASGTGTLLGITNFDIGTDWGDGQLFLTDLQINQAGTFTLGVSGFGSATSSSFTVSAAAADHLAMLTQTPASATAGVAFSPNPQVRIEDAFGNLRSGDTTTINAARNTGSGTAALQGTTSVAAVAGVATFTNLKYNVAGETISVDFSASGVTGVTSNPITVSAGPATTFTVTAPGSATAGTAINVTVTAKDSVGNVATSYTGTVHFTSNDGQAVLPSNYTFTGGDAGTKTFSVTLKTAGSRTVTATDTVTASINGTSNSVTVSADVASQLAITAPGSATAGTPFSVTVTAKDAYNNTATTYTGTVAFSTTDANSPVLPSSYLFTGGDAGTHTFTNGVTLKTAGTQTVSVNDGTFNATSGNITVGAAVVNTLTITAPGSATAGTPFSVTVTAKDAFNNTATGYTGTVSFSTTDGNSPVLPSNYTFTGGDAGTHTFTNGVTLKTAGNQTVSISDGTRNATSGTIVVGAGLVNTLTISAPGSATAGTPFSVTVTAKDAFNNTATSYTGTVSFSSTDPNAPVLPSNYAFTGGDAGAHTFTNGVTLKTAGTRTVSVSDGTRNATSGNIAVSAAAAATFTVAVPAGTTAGVAFTGTVTAKDAFNNTATSYTGTVHFTTSDANAPILPSNYTFTGGDAGVRTFTNGFTLKTAGSQSVTATDTVTSSITGSGSTTVSANNAAQLGFFVQPGGAQAGSVFSTQPVIKTLDAYGNVTTQNIGNSKTVTITLQSGTGTLQGTVAINIGDNGPTPGTATFTNLRIDTAGSKTLRASNNTYGTVDSNAFTVTAGPATQMYFSTNPSGATAGAPFTQQPVVKSRDSFGNDSNNGLGASKTVTMSLLSGTGTLLGTVTSDIGTGAGNGTAAYTNLQINAAGAKTLRASASGLTNADSSSFTVVAGAPAAMTKIAGDGQTADAGSAVATDPSVRIDDAFANPVSGVGVTFAVATGGGSVTGGSQSTNASGIATVTSWTLGPVAGPNTLTATAGALSQTFSATGICTYTSKASGNWSSPSTWVGECVPNSGNDVTIASGHTVTVTANAQAGSLTIAAATANTNVIINSGISLVVEGGVTILSPTQTGVTSTVNVGDGTLDAGGIDLNGLGNRKAVLTIHNGTATITGDATFGGNPPTQIIETTGNGTFEITGNFNTGGSLDTDPSSTFIFNGSEPSTIGTYNPNNFFPNVIIDNDVTMLGNMPVRSTLTINSGKTFDAGNGTLHLRGNFVDNGTFTSSGTTNVSGSAAQTFSGTQNPIPFDNLTMNNAAGLTLNQNATVSGTLTLTSGNISTGAQTLTILAGGGVSRTSGHVIGNFAKVFSAASSKTFEVGTANGYSPASVNATSGTFPATFTVKAVQGIHPNSPTTNALQRYWTLSNGSITQANLTFNYLASDVVGNELAYRLANYNSGWLYPAASVDTTNHIASASNVTSFADYTLHAQAVGLKITAVNGGTNPNADNAFSVDVAAVDALGNPTGVPANTNIALTLTTGTGALGGTLTGSIAFGSSTTTISGVTYRKAESGVVINAAVTSGAALAADDSDPFTVDPGATTHFDVSAPSTATAGSPFTATVTALDAWDNVTPAFAGTVHFTSTDAQATLPGDGTLTAGVGTYTNGVTLKTAGTQTITATSGAINGSANVNVSPAATDHLTLTAPSSTTAGDSFGVDVTAYDAYENITPAYAGTVSLTSSDPNATLPSPSTLTSGSKTFTGVVLTTAGAQTLTAGDGSLSDLASITVDPAALDHFLVDAAGGGSIAPQTAGVPFNIEAIARDAFDNTVTAFNQTVEITSNATMTGAPLTSAAFVNGVLASQAVTITSAQTGTTLSVTDTISGRNGTSNGFTVNPAGTASFLVEAGSGGSIAPQIAGVPFPVRITARDSFGNTDAAFTGTLDLTSNAGAVSPLTVTFVSGDNGVKTFSVTLTNANQAAVLTATHTPSGNTGSSNAFVVSAAGASQFLVEAATGGNIAPQTAGIAFGIRVTARDAFGNTDTTYTGTPAITTNLGDIAPTTLAFVSGDNGVKTTNVTLTASGTGRTITASDGNGTGTSNAFTVNAGALAHFRVEAAAGGNIGNQAAGAPFGIMVTALDANDNIVPSFNGASNTVDITSSHALASGGGTTATFVNGVLAAHNVSFNSGATNVTVTATRTGGSETGTSNAFAIGGQPDLALDFDGPASIDAGDGENFTFTVTNNGVSAANDVQLALTLPSGWSAHPFSPCAALPCNLGTLAPAASVSVTIRISTPASANGRYTLTANVTSAETDANPSDNTATHRVTIGHCPTVENLAPSGEGELAGMLTWEGSNASSYDVYFGLEDSGCTTLVGTTTQHQFPYSGLVLGQTYEFRIVANKPGCISAVSACVKFTTSCETPKLAAVAETITDATYHVQWTDTGATRYFIEESTNSDFAPADGEFVEGTSAAFQHHVTTPTAFFYRVRGEGGCSETYSDLIMVAVQPPAPPSDDEFDVVVEEGAQEDLHQQIHVGGQQGTTSLAGAFVAESTAPWATVEPSSGSIPPSGVTLTVTANAAGLPVGVSNATINVRSTDGSLIAQYPFSLHAMTPVDHGGKSQSASERAIVPAVGHAIGINSHWRSDVRIFNSSQADAAYDLYFTPSGIDGTTDGRHSRLTIAAGRTAALGDIVRHLFGYGTIGSESATGALEIRPVSDGPMPVITSRTYNATENGTYGQYIGAVPAAQFATSGTTLSLQQVAQSARYRTNLGLVEGSGSAANVTIRVFDASNAKLLELPVDLAAFEQRQLDSIMAQNSVTADDARIEVEVMSSEGSVAAYASVVDMGTNDPLLVPGVDASSISAMRYVVPGIADLTTPSNRWRSDVRIYNAGNASVQATAVFYGSNGASPIARSIVIPPHAMKAYDGIVQRLFAVTNRGGALHLTTPTASSLVVTARTYDSQPNGTYGQFIPAMTIADAATLGGRTLELLHVDQSMRFRTNIGLAEVAGHEATVELTAYVADGRTATRTLTLQAFEFLQYNALLSSLGLDDALNARLSIRVTGGQGAVVGYASNIDNRTQDPTYIPAQ